MRATHTAHCPCAYVRPRPQPRWRHTHDAQPLQCAVGDGLAHAPTNAHVTKWSTHTSMPSVCSARSMMRQTCKAHPFTSLCTTGHMHMYAHGCRDPHHMNWYSATLRTRRQCRHIDPCHAYPPQCAALTYVLASPSDPTHVIGS